MASPPFAPATTLPNDNDIVSQYPTVERTFRDVMTSFIETDHDATTGGHSKLTMTGQASNPAFTGSQVGVWAHTNGTFGTTVGPGDPEEFGVPLGTVLPTFRPTAPGGYLFCFGQTISRSSYSRLWIALGSPNTGDGATTFTMPDLRGRTLFGKDDMGGSAALRLNTADGGLDGLTLGAEGGIQDITLDTPMIPSHSHASPTLHDAQHGHFTFNADSSSISLGVGAATRPTPVRNTGDFNNYIISGSATVPTLGATSTSLSGVTIDATTGSTGSSLPHKNIPPALVCNWIMKF